jgi:HK97 family phage prohead protease
MLQRAWSQFTVKGMDDKRRRFSGIASTPSTDRMGDVVEPKGAMFKLPIPFLWQHDSKDPIGWITAAKVTDKGIEVEGEVANVDEAGPLKDRLLTAWQMLKAGIVRGLSIGFNASESEPIKGTYGLRFKKWEWLELSAVTIAANQDASILAIKSIDTALQAASGRTQSDPSPAVVGTKQPAPNGGFFVSQPQSKQVKTIAELRAERETKAARMGELMQLRKANDGTFGDAERAEYDAASNEVDSLDDDIRELKFHAVNSQGARAAEGTTQRSAVASRGRTLPTSFGAKEDEFLGQSYTRRVIAKALAAMNYGSAVEVASQRYKSNPLLVEVIKADVAGGGAGSGEWGAELVSADNRFNGDFIKFLHSKTVFDSLPLRSVPANVTIKGQDGAATANWVGESKAIPATAADFSTVSLTPQKVAAIAVVSNELLRDSSPSAEMLVRDALVEASAQKVDTHFFSTTAASSGVYPAGILNGVVVGTTGGATEAELIGDIAGLMRNFITAKYDINGLVWCMSPLLALQISLMRNALGQNAFATMPNTLEGRPVYSGHNVGTGDLILMSAGDIWKIGDSGVQVSISREATIEQDDAPQGATDTPVTMSTKFTNMFQAESTAIKVVRSINWAKRRTGAVHYIGNATYGELQSV